MSTTFAVIRGYMRAALLDYDSNCYVYSDSALNSQIRLTMLSLDDETIYLEGQPEVFSIELSNAQKTIVALKSAIRILSGNANSFSYSSPAFSLRRVGGIIELRSELEDMLSDAEGGKFAIESDTDFDALVQGTDRYVNDFNRAFSAWSGTG